MRVAIVNYVWDGDLSTPEEALARFSTLTGWAEAIRDPQVPQALAVEVYQRFHKHANLERGEVAYRFRTDYGTPHPGQLFRRADGVHTAVSAAAPDLVHVNGVIFPELLRQLRGRLPERCALVAQDHGGMDPSSLSVARRTWLRRGLSVVDALLVSAAGQADAWRASGALPEDVPAHVVMESSTTLERVDRDRARRETGTAGEPAILWVGRLNANKDPLTVVRGVASFAAGHPGTTLTFVYGEDDLEGEVRRALESVPALARAVRLAGRRPHEELAAWYSAADLFVLGSRSEGSGYAVIEALACGAVPVVTDIPSFRALTGEGRVGALWTPGDAGSLEAALQRVATRPLEPARRAAMALFDREFSWRAIGEKARTIYEDVLRTRREERPPGAAPPGR